MPRKGRSTRTARQHGAVPPRVLNGVLDEGSFVEDECYVRAFRRGPALSRSVGGQDDRSAASIDVLDSLSSFQVRGHYVLYRAAQTVIAAHPEIDLHVGDARNRIVNLAVSTGIFSPQSASRIRPGRRYIGAVSHIMNGLSRADLLGSGLGSGWNMGTPEMLRTIKNVVWPEHAVTFQVTQFGAELFCAAHGFHSSPWDDLKRPTADFAPRWAADIPPCEAIVVADLPLQPSPPPPVG